jgi:hypothetical protein
VKYVEVRERLLAVTGVTAVHNLHIWALTMNQAVLSAHVAIGETPARLHLLIDRLRSTLAVCFTELMFHILDLFCYFYWYRQKDKTAFSLSYFNTF